MNSLSGASCVSVPSGSPSRARKRTAHPVDDPLNDPKVAFRGMLLAILLLKKLLNPLFLSLLVCTIVSRDFRISPPG